MDFLYSHTHGKSYNTTDKEARHWQEAEDETYLVRNHETGRGRDHTHTFRLGADYLGLCLQRELRHEPL